MLERRELLAAPVAGTDYVLSGYSWSNPARITYSIAPDGVNWDHGTNDLNAVFDAKFGAGVWERQIARALATWEASANINIVPVSDSANDFDCIGLAQGDPRFGDIRFGGYAFASSTTLAQTYYPPPNGWTAAGDVEVNTAMNFNIGSDYDLYSVLLHETGHSLGLAHALNPAEVMYASYGGVRAGLSPGDVAGIQAIYGARVPDSYHQQGYGGSLGYAFDLTSQVNGYGQETASGFSLSTIGDTEFFSVIAPPSATGTLQVSADASGISMLSPQISVYNASGQLINTAANPSAWSDDVTAQVSKVVPGQRYFVEVTGATSDAFAVGAYSLTVDFAGVTPVTPVTPPVTPVTPPVTPVTPPVTPVTPPVTPVTPPVTPVTPPVTPVTPPVTPVTPPVTSPSTPVTSPTIPPDRFEPNNTPRTATSLGLVSQTTVSGLTLNTAADLDYFVFANARAGAVVVSAKGTSLRLLDSRGHVLAQGNNQLSVVVSRARTVLYVQVRAPGNAPVASYSLGITAAASTSNLRSKLVSARQEIAPTATASPALPGGPSAISLWRWRARRR